MSLLSAVPTSFSPRPWARGARTILAVASLLGASPSFSASSTPATARPIAEIHGRVLGEDGNPIPHATIRLAPEGPADAVEPVVVESTEDGSFAAPGLAASILTLRVEAPGRAPLTQPGVPAGASVRAVLKKGLSVRGVVRDRATRSPLAGATVIAWEPGADVFGEAACRRALSRPDGGYSIDDLPAGVVILEAWAPGHAAARRDGVSVPPLADDAGSPGIALDLAMGGALAGRVVSPPDRAVTGASLRLRPVEEAARREISPRVARPVRSDAAGAFAVEGLPPGRYLILAGKAGFADAEVGPFEVQGGKDRRDLQIRLEAAAVLRARLVFPDGKPVADLDVELLDPKRGSPGPVVSQEQVSDEGGGRFLLEGLVPGTYSLRLVPFHGEEVERRGVALRSGQTTDLGTIVVRPDHGIAGRVTDTAGAAVEGAEVAASWREGDAWKALRARTGSNGSYRIRDLPESVLSVAARARGYGRAQREGVSRGDRSVDFALERTGSLAGRVATARGAPLTAFRVRVRLATEEGKADDATLPSKDPDEREQAFQDPQGSFRIEDLDAGTYTVEVVAQGYPPVRKEGIHVLEASVADLGTVTVDGGVTMRGRVVSARDNSPVQGAAVRLAGLSDPSGGRSPSAASLADGSFTLEGLTAGELVLTVEHPDFSPSRERILVSSDAEAPEVVVRLFQGGAITGIVRDAQRQPVPEAGIVIAHEETGETRTVLTGPDGRYLAARLVPGGYQVSRAPDAARVGLAPAPRAGRVREGETTTIDFDESPRVSVSGTLLRGSLPLEGVALRFVPDNAVSPGEVKTTQSGERGEYAIGLDRAGPYRVWVAFSEDGRFRGQRQVHLEIPDEPEVRRDIVVAPSGIAGRVLDQGNGDGVPDAIVAARLERSQTPGPIQPATAQSGPDGSYRLEGLDPGTYRITARAKGYRAAEAFPVEISEDEPSATADLRMQPGRMLRGRVVDPNERGIPGAFVFIAASGANPSLLVVPPAQTGLDGVFEITAPADGALDVTAVPEGWAPVRLNGIPAQNDSEIVLRATPGGFVRVTVLGADGMPLPGVQVALRPIPPFPGSDTAVASRRPMPTGSDGTTVVDRLAPGVYEVFALGQRDTVPARAGVSEGAEAAATIQFR